MILLPEDPPPPPYDGSSANPSPVGEKHEQAQRFVYYRLYTPNGIIPPKTAIVASESLSPESLSPQLPVEMDPFLGRIPARSIPPPHNVASLKRSIMSKEHFTFINNMDWAVYTHSQRTQMLDNSTKIAILGPGATDGVTPETAFAVVVPMPLELPQPPAQQRETDSNARDVPPYLYYRLFTTGDEDLSKTAFKPASEPSLGRIAAARIPPPQDVRAVKHCIARAEGQPAYAMAQMYESMAGEVPMDDGLTVSLGEGGVGASEDSPVVLVRPAGHGFSAGWGLNGSLNVNWQQLLQSMGRANGHHNMPGFFPFTRPNPMQSPPPFPPFGHPAHMGQPNPPHFPGMHPHLQPQHNPFVGNGQPFDWTGMGARMAEEGVGGRGRENPFVPRGGFEND